MLFHMSIVMIIMMLFRIREASLYEILEAVYAFILEAFTKFSEM